MNKRCAGVWGAGAQADYQHGRTLLRWRLISAPAPFRAAAALAVLPGTSEHERVGGAGGWEREASTRRRLNDSYD